ncbi:hypothetical protein [Moraxella phage Mcat27]|nr:hypothetical protein [Moraxella phage Mcat27]
MLLFTRKGFFIACYLTNNRMHHSVKSSDWVSWSHQYLTNERQA